MAWTIPSANTISGLTYIKDTDNKLQATMQDLEDYVNAVNDYAGGGLSTNFVDRTTAQSIDGVKTFTSTINANLAGNVTGNVTGNVVGDITGDVVGDVTGDVTGNLSGKLTTARTISLTGDVTGSVSFDGSSDVSINSTIDSSYVKTSSASSIDSTNPLSLSNDNLSLKKGDGNSDTVVLPMIGAGQTWQDVKSSRADGVTYTNNTGKPIMISVSVASGSAIFFCDIDIDGVTVHHISRFDLGNADIHTASVIVPNGSSYTVNYSGSIAYWSELR